jgi:hypothetical protein
MALGVEDVLEENRLDYMHTVVKVVLTADLPKLVVCGHVYEDTPKGSLLNMWLWAADTLVKMGLAEYLSKPPSTTLLMQLEWKEKNNPSEIQPLPKHFYVEWAREVEKGNTEAAKRLADILTIRMMKIVALAAKRLDGEVVRKLTPEEEALYREVYTTVDKWNKSFREAGI